MMEESKSREVKNKPKKRRKLYVWAIVTVGILGLMFVIEVPYYISGYGNVMSYKDAVLRAGVKGAIKRIKVESGDKVKEGQILIELEDSVQQAAVLTNERKLSQAKMELSKLIAQMHYELAMQKSEIELARIRLRDIEKEYERIKKLFSQQAASKTEMRKAEIAYELAKTRLAEVSLDKKKLFEAEIAVQEKKIGVLESLLKVAKARLALRKIRAPISGIIVLHTLSVGQVVDADQVLGQIFAEGGYQIIARIPEKYLWFTKKGKKVMAETRSYPHRDFGYLSGKISWVSPVINPNSSGDGTLLVKADVISVPERVVLKPGQSAQIWIDAGKVPVIYYLLGIRKFN